MTTSAYIIVESNNAVVFLLHRVVIRDWWNAEDVVYILYRSRQNATEFVQRRVKIDNNNCLSVT